MEPEERIEKCRFIGMSELEISTVSFWEVKFKGFDYPIVVAVWYTVGSLGYSWGFQIMGEDLQYVNRIDKVFFEIYQYDQNLSPEEDGFLKEIKEVHEAVLRCGHKAGLV